MKIKKRNGREVNFNPTKITSRIKKLDYGLKVNSDMMAVNVIGQMADGITTEELDTLCIETAASRVPHHPDYGKLAARLFVTALRKSTPDTFSDCMITLESKNNILSEEYVQFVYANSDKLNNMIVQDRDFGHDIFGLRTLERSYLARTDKNNGLIVVERPQYMWMRVAIEVTDYDIEKIQETYDLMSSKYYTHATPTLFNANTKNPQLSSCFLLGMKDDSINGIYDTLKDTALISQWAGGIGLHIHNVRATGSHIKGTNGTSNGIVPMLKVYNETARYVDQGGGKRKGSFAIYIEPWHADIYELLDLKKNHGKEEMRARDLFYALWNNDLFMERIQSNKNWSLFCPNTLLKEGIVLQDLVGDDFKEAYFLAESKNLEVKKVKAQDLWEKILVSQMETGNPYMGYKDRVNIASNQKNIGTIKSSNLCIEINEYSDDKEQAVCNLASIALPMFVENGVFNYDKFKQVVRVAVNNLDNVIDANYYPTPETEFSNNKHRPIGLGVQGLADVFALMKIAFDSEKAKKINKDIFEHMYFYALEASMELAYKKGAYSTFDGSPASKGILQFDMYEEDVKLNPSLDWGELKRSIQENGLRNSLLIALMPTASTSQILGNNEAFEPFTSNLYTRSTLSGTFIINNYHLVRDLEELGLWDKTMMNKLMIENGSIQNIPTIPTEIKERYKTAFEMSMKTIIDMASDRQKFVCQAQSMNLFMGNASVSKVSSMHFYSWKKKLKTGMYYLRTKAAVDATKFTVTKEEVKEKPIDPEEFRNLIKQSSEAAENDEDCLMCGS